MLVPTDFFFFFWFILYAQWVISRSFARSNLIYSWKICLVIPSFTPIFVITFTAESSKLWRRQLCHDSTQNSTWVVNITMETITQLMGGFTRNETLEVSRKKFSCFLHLQTLMRPLMQLVCGCSFHTFSSVSYMSLLMLMRSVINFFHTYCFMQCSRQIHETSSQSHLPKLHSWSITELSLMQLINWLICWLVLPSL